MKPTSLETLMNCNVLPMKKNINFYSFGGEERMRKEHHSDFLTHMGTQLYTVRKFLKLV